jgi:hypothetical protein
VIGGSVRIQEIAATVTATMPMRLAVAELTPDTGVGEAVIVILRPPA